MALQQILCSALAVVAAACSGDCLADEPKEQLALVQRHASKHLVADDPSYILAELGSDPSFGTNSACPSGYATIQDEGTCQEAATSLGLSWESTGSWANNAVGCIRTHLKHVYFNNHATGAPVSTTAPICRVAPPSDDTAVVLQSAQACEFVEHNSVGAGVDGGWVNDWDSNMNFECPNGQVLAGAYSVHDNGKEDRRWKLECQAFKAKTGYLTPYLQSCSWSGYTGWDASWTEPSRGSNYVIVGVKSHHDNGKEDRQYSFKSCAVADVDGSGQRSGVSGWQNSWDGTLDTKLSDTDFFGDWKSQHDNGKEDRQFAFDTAKFRYMLA